MSDPAVPHLLADDAPVLAFDEGLIVFRARLFVSSIRSFSRSSATTRLMAAPESRSWALSTSAGSAPIFMGVVGREPVPLGLYLCCQSVPSTQA